MALAVGGEVVGLDIGDAPFVNVSGCDQVGGDEFAQPSRRAAVVFVVVGAAHGRTSGPLR
jgi:hypothetical protein